MRNVAVLILQRVVRLLALLLFAGGIFHMAQITFWLPHSLNAPPNPMFLTVLLVGVALFLLMPERRRGGARLAVLFILVLLIAAPFVTLEYLMGSNDVESLLVFFRDNNLSETVSIGIEGFADDLVEQTVIYVLFALVAIYLILRVRCFWIVAAALSLTLVALHPVTTYLRTALIPNQAHALVNVETDVHAVDITARPDAPKNLIILYLESYERSLFTLEETSDAAREIEAISETGVNMLNVHQVNGTHHSTAGIVATQCGVPLLPKGLVDIARSRQNLADGFLSGVTCLGDVLRGEGYNVSYMVGADLDGYSQRAFFETHAYNRLFSLESLTPSERENRMSVWGAHDDLMFEKLREEIVMLAALDEPFSLSFATMATHGPSGYPDPDCEYEATFDSLLPAAIYCTGQHVRALLEFLDAEGLTGNTVIAVMSDHLSRPGDLSRDLRRVQEDRRNLFFMLNLGEAAQVAKVGSAIDIYPTLIESLGYELAQGQAGLGVSLLSDNATLAERLGPEQLDSAFTSNHALSDRLWQAPAK